MKIGSFDPLKHGYHFANYFTSHLLFGITTHGLCGGMSIGAIDHWRNGIAGPNHFASDPFGNDFGGALVPAEGGRLQSAIYERQVHSLETSAVFTRWLFGPASMADGFNASVGPEFTEIRRRLDAGRPCIVGLWAAGQGDVLRGHQVLSYGYETSPMSLYVYDPNHPDVECQLIPVSPEQGVRVRLPGQDAESYRGWFAADVYNWNESPPWSPRYVDLVLTDGIRLNSPADVTAGQPLEVTATIQNRGQYPSRFKALYIYVRDPHGFNVDHVLHGAEPGVTVLQPGETHTMTRRADTFAANAPGGYRIGASYLSLTDRWCDFAVTDASRRFIDVVAHAPSARLIFDQWVSVAESAQQPVPTGISLAPGDQVGLTGQGSIWAGVWLTGPNGPEGWSTTSPPIPASHSTAPPTPASSPSSPACRASHGSTSATASPVGPMVAEAARWSSGSTMTSTTTARAPSNAEFRSGGSCGSANQRRGRRPPRS